MGGATLTAAASPVWRPDGSGVGHALESPVALTTACGEELDPRRPFMPMLERCLECLELVGITVSVRAPSGGLDCVRAGLQVDLTGWAPGEVTEAFGS